MKTDVIEKYYDAVLRLGLGEKQKRFYELCKSSLKHVEITHVEDLPKQLKEQVKEVISMENIEIKECYKNSAMFVADAKITLSGRYFAGYCEGMVVTDNVPIPIEHAWNCIYDRHENKMYYIDLTLEFGIKELGKDYAIIKEYDELDISKMMLKYRTFGSWYQDEFKSQINKELHETVK